MSNQRILNLPKHKNPQPDRTASATYNFVPLPETVVTAVDDKPNLDDAAQFGKVAATGNLVYEDLALGRLDAQGRRGHEHHRLRADTAHQPL